MLKISIAAVGIFLSTLIGFSQTFQDSSSYKNRKLKVEEVNFVSSYYQQDGDNSAVTGGIGTEKLTDLATTIDVRLSRYDARQRKHILTGEIGFDSYSSASSDKIDPSTVSSASAADKRIYPSVMYSISNEKKGSTTSVTGSISTEYDYFSKGISVGWSKLSKDKNREFSARGQVYLDTWSIILPVELRGGNEKTGKEPRNSYSTSFTLSQILSKRMQILFLADVAYQEGELATLYHRTYFTDGSHRVENLPDSRIKVPLGMRLNYFAGDRFIFRSYYRYYRDSWGMDAHTIELETTVKITPFFSLTPFYRYYEQQDVRYFQKYKEHSANEEFYTSDYDLSTFKSNMVGAGMRLAPPGGLLGLKRFNTLEIRYGHYERSTGLNANIISLFAKFK
jgi:hypothetical protein